METTFAIKDWIPLISSLVTPIFVVGLVLYFRSDVLDLIGIIKTAVGEQQRSLAIGDWIKIGERAQTTEISDMGLGDLSVSLGEHDYEEWLIEKGDESLILGLREQSERHGGKPVDVMALKEGVRYSAAVLEKYVSLLGVKFILFTGRGQFEGWIPAGLFLGQLHPGEIYTYSQLKNETIGVRTEHAPPSSTAKDVLAQMQSAGTDYIAIVSSDNGYRYMVSKQDVLAKLVSAMILNHRPRGQNQHLAAEENGGTSNDPKADRVTTRAKSLGVT